MHVDNTLQLWAFFDVYGNTKKIKILFQCKFSSMTKQSTTFSEYYNRQLLKHSKERPLPWDIHKQ
ncbi:hypothetical protein Anas_12646 [Armadillidium nasatum]|uniref:NHR domain-containing protein n=1 Tax=Armadillidium nasatum TaxID=96803 RepID=A0A5N5TD47_9CRUS|nr:hypothetical protein Anas_12646 [Armadillidium nasatum]